MAAAGPAFWRMGNSLFIGEQVAEKGSSLYFDRS
jgi:hypothetical protein